MSYVLYSKKLSFPQSYILSSLPFQSSIIPGPFISMFSQALCSQSSYVPRMFPGSYALRLPEFYAYSVPFISWFWHSQGLISVGSYFSISYISRILCFPETHILKTFSFQGHMFLEPLNSGLLCSRYLSRVLFLYTRVLCSQDL